MGLPYGEEIMIVGWTVWTQSTSVTDRRTVGRSDRQTDRQNYYHKDRATHGNDTKFNFISQLDAIAKRGIYATSHPSVRSSVSWWKAPKRINANKLFRLTSLSTSFLRCQITKANNQNYFISTVLNAGGA